MKLYEERFFICSREWRISQNSTQVVRAERHVWLV